MRIKHKNNSVRLVCFIEFFLKFFKEEGMITDSNVIHYLRSICQFGSIDRLYLWCACKLDDGNCFVHWRLLRIVNLYLRLNVYNLPHLLINNYNLSKKR